MPNKLDRLFKELDLWDIFECQTIDNAIKKLEKLKEKYGNDYNLHFDVEFADNYHDQGKVIYLIGKKK